MVINNNIPVGKITENKKIVAYKIYNTAKNKVTLVSSKQVRNLLDNGVSIVGLDLYDNSYGVRQLKRFKNFLWNNIPELNGEGLPENGEHIQVLIGFIGYKEKRHYITVNDIGDIKVYSIDDMIKLLSKEKVVGVSLDKNGRIMPYIKDEYYAEDLISKGFIKDNCSNWIKDIN